jgi:Ca-activated chloride channel family protein
LEGGDIGSGHSVTAIFEIAPSTNMVSDNSPFANIEISFQLPGDTNHLSIKHFVQNPLMPFESIDPGYRKSAVLALFGMKLRKSGYAAGVKWGTLQKMAHHEFDKNNTMEKELIALIHLAKKLYTHPRRFDSGY